MVGYILLIVAVVTASAVCAGAVLFKDVSCADDQGECGNGLSWEFTENDRTLRISGSGAMADYDDGEKKTPWYAFRGEIEFVILPEGLTRIGNYAFCEFSSLDHIEIPGNVKSIGKRAFDTCTISTFISIPESMKTIGSDAFRDCLVKTVYNFSGLDIQPLDYMLPSDAVIVSDRCGEHLLWEYAESSRTLIFFGSGDMNDYTDAGTPWYSVRKEAEHVVFPAGLTHIGGYALRGFGSLASVAIPENVTSIGDGAFYGCCMIPSVTVPRSVETIGDEAFCGCAGLTSAVLSGSLKTIGDGAFYACTRLTEMNIPDGVTSVGSQAFCGCIGLTSVTVPRSVEAIGDEAFLFCPVRTLYNYSSLEIGKGAFGLPDTAEIFSDMCGDDLFWKYDEDSGTLVLVGKGAMYDYPDESEVPWYGFSEDAAAVELPAGLTHIGNHAFSGFASLTSVAVPGSVVSVGDWAFSGCSGLTEVSVSSGSAMASIGDSAFSYCYSLRSLSLPVSLTAIGTESFSYCCSLASLTIPGRMETISEQAFSHCSALSSVTVSGSVTAIGKQAFFECGSLAEIVFPDRIETIGEQAFSQCVSLEFVSLPHSLGLIGDLAFADCPVATLHNYSDLKIVPGSYGLPDSVHIISDRCGYGLLWDYDRDGRTLTVIGSGEMDNYNCVNPAPWSGLRDEIAVIELPDGLTSVGDSAFTHFTSLTSVSIPGSVTSIGYWAFSSGSLASVDIPDSVETINNGAFAGCRSLTSITIPRSVTAIDDCAFGGIAGTMASGYGSIRTVYNCSDLAIRPGQYGLPEDAAVYSDACGDRLLWEYSESGQTLVFYGRGAMDDFLPSGDTAPWYGLRYSVENIVLPEGLTRIGNYAFYEFTSLRSVTIPETVKEIGNYAFCSCGRLTALDIPGSVTAIGIRAFGECRSLASVSVLGSAETVGDYAFCGCGSLTCVIIPETVKEIGKDAFKGCPIGTVYNYSGIHIAPDDVGLSPDASVRNECPSVIEVSFFNGTGYLGKCEETVGRHYVLPRDPKPVQEGSVFIGWFDSEGTEITSDTIVTPDDGELYAKWDFCVLFSVDDDPVVLLEAVGKDRRMNRFPGHR